MQSVEHAARDVGGGKSTGGRPRAGGMIEPEHARVLAAYVRTGTKAKVARELDISPTTVASILRLPLVAAELRAIVDIALASVRTQFLVAVSLAVDTLVSLLDDADPNVRMKASLAIIDRALSLPDPSARSETEKAIDERIAALTSTLEVVEG